MTNSIVMYIAETFNSFVKDDNARKGIAALPCGVVSMTKIPDDVAAIFNREYAPIEIETFFSREERSNLSIAELIGRQLMHYFEVYGEGEPGVHSILSNEGRIMKVRLLQGVSVSELSNKIRELVYSNTPVKDAATLVSVIQFYKIEINPNLVKNNEIKMLFGHDDISWDDGDDAVRFIVYRATGDTLLIKSPEVIAAVKASTNLPANYFYRNIYPLAKVFNRHKKIILAAKTGDRKSAINKISRASKTYHIPIRESINKTFIAKALDSDDFDLSVLSKIDIADKFKYLNLLEGKNTEMNSYVIRNGKVYSEVNDNIVSMDRVNQVKDAVLASLYKDLVHLRGESILLDKDVDFGLPISEKQSLGRLPYGTQVTVDSDEISAGMHWKNSGGAIDLDLSAMDKGNNRVGWGQYSAYGSKNISFSGDVTNAPDPKGAMEFMTSSDRDYGLFINIYNGQVGATAQIVVGGTKEDRWITNPIIQEPITLDSRGMVFGFVKDKTFTVFKGRLSKKAASFGKTDPVIERGLSKFWTVKKLFNALNIKFDVDKQEDKVYKYTQQYETFTFHSLKDMLS